jgi:hypothetical protein
MQPTPKWNEELPLNPGAELPLPPPRRYEIQIDNGRKIPILISRTRGPRPPRKQLMMKSTYSITGTSLREDELMEHAAGNSERGLVVDGRGNIHRFGENFAPGGMTMRMGSSFFPPTYTGEEVPSYPGGNVITRRRLRNLVRSGRLKPEPNMVNSFRPGRLIKRRRPFPRELAWEAAALTNPGAYHGLVIPGSAHVRMQGLVRGVRSGALVIGRDGTVYKKVPNPSSAMGFSLRKIGRVIKRGAKSVGRGVVKLHTAPVKFVAKRVVKPIGKTAWRGVKTTGRFVKKNAMPIAMTAALGPAGLAVYAGVKNRKKLLAVVKKVGSWTGHALAAAAKAMARVAATPIRLAVRPAVNAAVRKLARGGPATPAVKKAGSNLVIARLKSSGNPMAKLAGAILSYTGTGVGGSSMMGAALVHNDTAIIGGYVTGCAGDSTMGFTGAEIAALASACVAAITPLVKQMATEFAKGKAEELVQKAISPSTQQAAQPMSETPAPTPEAPSSPLPESYTQPPEQQIETHQQTLSSPPSDYPAPEAHTDAPPAESSGYDFVGDDYYNNINSSGDDFMGADCSCKH